jgi:hypothetical protein
MTQRHEVEATLRGSWGEWIGRQPWDLFVTLTSEKQTHPEAMLKRFRYCMNKASDHVYGRSRKPQDRRLQWVAGLERTKQGWPHSHAVVRFPGTDIRGQEGRNIFDLGYWQKWMTATGGFAWLEIPRSEQAVVQYVTKYVVKDGELELSRTVDFAQAPGSQLLLDQGRRAGRQPEAPAAAARSLPR